MLNFLSRIEEERQRARTNGLVTMSALAIDQATRDKWAEAKSPCNDDPRNLKCLFLYLYAVDSWCAEGNNSLGDDQLSNIILRIEQIAKTCCDHDLVYDDTLDPGTLPGVDLQQTEFSTEFEIEFN